jgi:hypothetical protein
MEIDGPLAELIRPGNGFDVMLLGHNRIPNCCRARLDPSMCKCTINQIERSDLVNSL